MAIITGTALESNKKSRVNFDGGNLSSDTYHVLSEQKRFFSADLCQGLELPKGFDIVTTLVSQ